MVEELYPVINIVGPHPKPDPEKTADSCNPLTNAMSWVFIEKLGSKTHNVVFRRYMICWIGAPSDRNTMVDHKALRVSLS